MSWSLLLSQMRMSPHPNLRLTWGGWAWGWCQLNRMWLQLHSNQNGAANIGSRGAGKWWAGWCMAMNGALEYSEFWCGTLQVGSF